MAEKLYGFQKETARKLNEVARRSGLKSRTGAKVKYPKPINDDVVMRIGKPVNNIAKGATNSVTIWNAETAAATSEVVQAKALAAAVTAAKYCTLVNLNGVWLVAPWEC